ncbi:MAG: 2,3,4,5-tetrahydropyridine-2,6-carboxylate N-succinyltransferase, partial [Epsilonproteobacteria bacterium]|nr:2,3,4,5-tetrahydropyridine-2,6-carboxylate N-succinyltransferase [Campylobacterota bacterium]
MISVEDFYAVVKEVQESSYYRQPLAFGIARVDLGQKNKNLVLQATFPFINWEENYGSSAIFQKALNEAGEIIPQKGSEAVFKVTPAFVQTAFSLCSVWVKEAEGEKHKNVQLMKVLSELDESELENFRVVFLFEDAPPESVEATYLKLYALSLGKVPLRGVNLEGAFGILPNVAWSGNTPIELEWLREKEIELKVKGEFPKIDFVDKFPRYLQHI